MLAHCLVQQTVGGMNDETYEREKFQDENEIENSLLSSYIFYKLVSALYYVINSQPAPPHPLIADTNLVSPMEWFYL